jgi:transposase InsO family protein
VLRQPFESAQYTSLAFGKRLSESGIVSSMGSVGDAYVNAAAESFIATIKSELLHRYSWPTRMDAELAIFDFIEVFYNRRRRHSTNGQLSPMVFEQRYWSTVRVS